MKKSLIIAALGAVLGLGSLNASATSTITGDSTLGVALTLTSACTVAVTTAGSAVTSPALSTGSATLSAPNIGGVTVTDCTAAYKLGADGGANYATGTAALRDVKYNNGTTNFFVSYKLGISQTTGTSKITDVPASTDWGSTGMTFATVASSAASVSKTGSTTADIYVISAEFSVPAVGSAPAGAYTDTVAIGVEF